MKRNKKHTDPVQDYYFAGRDVTAKAGKMLNLVIGGESMQQNHTLNAHKRRQCLAAASPVLQEFARSLEGFVVLGIHGRSGDIH